MAAILPNPRRRSARKPGPAVQRLAGHLSGQRQYAGLDSCLRRPIRVLKGHQFR